MTVKDCILKIIIDLPCDRYRAGGGGGLLLGLLQSWAFSIAQMDLRQLLLLLVLGKCILENRDHFSFQRVKVSQVFYMEELDDESLSSKYWLFMKMTRLEVENTNELFEKITLLLYEIWNITLLEEESFSYKYELFIKITLLESLSYKYELFIKITLLEKESLSYKY